MDGKTIALCVTAAVAGLIGGFVIANSINRSEIAALRAESERARSSANSSPDTKTSLTEEEINTTIRRADQNAGDFQIQRSHGLALYRYAAMKQDVKLLQESARILDRAASLKPEDYDVLVSLGHANFDVGYHAKNNDALKKARELYGKALAVKPNDIDVRTDVGLTYFLQTPPDLESSVREFQRSIAIDPKHEKTLLYLIQALIKMNRSGEAAEYLDQLRAVNPRNESIPELASMLATAQAAG